ncbi:MAG: FecR family protein [Opitutaceae bacterium]
MNPSVPTDPRDPGGDEAAAWVVRLERGLTAAEQDQLSAWLAADPRHGRALARMRAHWARLAPLAEWRPEHSAEPNPDLLAPPAPTRRWFRPVLAAAAAAALAALALFVGAPPSAPAPDRAGPESGRVVVREAQATRQVLPDGSLAELNHGAALQVDYTAGERRLELLRGEAHFRVVRDPGRPFVVRAHGREIRALGTAFNVRLEAGRMEVLVTSGRVRLGEETSPAAPEPPAAGPTLEAGQRAVVTLDGGAPEPRIATLTAGEIERVLAWQHRTLEFSAAPLAEVIAAFNQANELQLALGDPALAGVQLSASFRSDNVEGFVRLLEVGFRIRGVRDGDRRLVLRAATP